MHLSLFLKEHRQETPEIESFIFSSNQKINYQPGQFLRWNLPHQNPDNRGIWRYFTVSSSPAEGIIMLTTKFSTPSSTFKTTLHSLKIGQEITVEGPFGDFTYPDPTVKAVFIAGGIGITPFRSILTQLDLLGTNSPIIILYSNRNEEIPFKVLLDDISKRRKTIKIIYTVTEKDSRYKGETDKIDANFVKQYVPNYLSTGLLYYLSGPKPMVESIEKELIFLKISKQQIKKDFFPGYTEI